MTYKLNLLKINSTDTEVIEEQARYFALGVVEGKEERGTLHELVGALCDHDAKNLEWAIGYAKTYNASTELRDIAFYALFQAIIEHNS